MNQLSWCLFPKGNVTPSSNKEEEEAHRQSKLGQKMVGREHTKWNESPDQSHRPCEQQIPEPVSVVPCKTAYEH